MNVPVTLVVRTGVRRGEAMALRWEDLDLRWAYVRCSVQRITGESLVFGPAKSHRSSRPARFDETAVKLLWQHQLNQEEDRRFIGDEGW